jgi:hypothetical protein
MRTHHPKRNVNECKWFDDTVAKLRPLAIEIDRALNMSGYDWSAPWVSLEEENELVERGQFWIGRMSEDDLRRIALVDKVNNEQDGANDEIQGLA